MNELGNNAPFQDVYSNRPGSELLKLYTGSDVSEFKPYILLVNSDLYVARFADFFSQTIIRGIGMSVCHSEEHKISVVNFGIGSPAAAFIIELLSYVNPAATLFLGSCQGLRDMYKIGDFFNPVAAIRGEGTSSFYLPENCPSLSSFVIQRYVCQTLEQNAMTLHTGVIHTTNILLWSSKEGFKELLDREKVQATDNECATLFTVGFVYLVPVGALMLISNLPFQKSPQRDARLVTEKNSIIHLQAGIKILKNMQRVEVEGFGYQF